MNVVLAGHVIGILHGIGASVAVFALLWITGLACISLVTTGDATSENDTLTDHAYPAMVGAALLAIWCWYGVARGIGLSRLFVPFGGFCLALSAIRARQIWRVVSRRRGRWLSTLGWLGAFSVFYVIAYAFFTPDVTGHNLPIATYLNNDLMNYLNFARAFQDRTSNLASGSFLTSPAYAQTPAVIATVALMGMWYGGDPMQAAMPLQYACSALIALVAARGVRRGLGISLPWALALGGAIISGPFFRYVAGNYFLSTLISLPIVMNLLWLTVARINGRAIDRGLWMRFAVHYVLLVLNYPVLLVLAIGMQVGIAGLAAIAPAFARATTVARWRQVVAPVTRIALGIAAGMTLVALVLPGPLRNAVNGVLYLSQKGVAGWPMNMISPAALFGFPGHFDRVQITPGSEDVALLVLTEIGLVLLWIYFWWLRDRTTLSERLYVGIGSAALLLYCAAFWMLGPSYQQWKLASYLPLPLSCLTVAAVLRLVDIRWPPAGGSRVWVRRIRATLPPVLFAVYFVGGNVWAHESIEPPPYSFPAAFANLKKIDALPSFRELYVEMDDYRDTFVPVYFIRSKELHLISKSYYANEPLVLDRVSRSWPFLLQDFWCEGVGHDRVMTIEGVGCLMFDPPTPELDQVYPFGQTYYFVKPIHGIAGREDWGRWNDGPSAQLQLSVDALRIPTTEVVYVNFRLAPHLPPGTTVQRVGFAWGARKGEVSLTAEEWMSLKVEPSDWKGLRVQNLAIDMSMPDGAAAAPKDPDGDHRLLAFGFKSLSVSKVPRGLLVRSQPVAPREREGKK